MRENEKTYYERGLPQKWGHEGLRRLWTHVFKSSILASLDQNDI